VYWQQGHIERGIQVGEEAIRVAHEGGDAWLIALAMLSLGAGLFVAGQTARSVDVLDESARRFRAVGDERCVALSLTSLGMSMVAIGDHERARTALLEALHILRIVGERRYRIFALRGLAECAGAQGSLREAVQLFATSEAMSEAIAMRHSPVSRKKGEQFLESLRQRLPTSEFEHAYTVGERMSLDDVLAELGTVP
jgi:hypothetical protein